MPMAAYHIKLFTPYQILAFQYYTMTERAFRACIISHATIMKWERKYLLADWIFWRASIDDELMSLVELNFSLIIGTDIRRRYQYRHASQSIMIFNIMRLGRWGWTYRNWPRYVFAFALRFYPALISKGCKWIRAVRRREMGLKSR